MKMSEESGVVSRAWVRALRAAALLLSAEVCRQVLARRADIPPSQRRHLRQISWRAWHEAYELYSPDIWDRFQVDEPELRRRAIGIAQLRMRGHPERAGDAEREALRRALSAA